MEDPELAEQLVASYQSCDQSKTVTDGCKTVDYAAESDCSCLPPSKNARDGGEWPQNDALNLQSKGSGDSDLILAGRSIDKQSQVLSIYFYSWHSV